MAIHRDQPGPFVGRADELERLAQLRRDSQRYGRFALIAGEPGIGKSRLVDEFLRSTPRGRVAIGSGRALEHVRSPFAPWISALEPVAPEAARAIRPDAGFAGKAAMYAAVVEALRTCVERRSVILTLEDLHWADAGSLDLLHVVLSELQALRRLLVLATVRSSQAHDTVRRIATNPQAAVVELQPLPARECLELVRSLLADETRVASARVERIAALSGGNPFFATQLSHNGHSGEIPLTISSAIEARLAPLQADELHALEAAAILGEAFDLQLLADVANTSPAGASKLLESAERAGIVAEESSGQFRFAHALTRAVLASHLTSAQRIDVHTRAARALEHRRRFDAFGFARLAYHHAGAHDNVKAYAYHMRAGGLAYTVHAYTDSASFYAGAAACAEEGSLERAGALARQGDASLRATLLDDAESAYRASIAIYRAAGAVEEAARLYQSLTRSLYNQGRVRDAFAAIEQATVDLAPLPPQLNDELSIQAALYGADISPEAGLRWLQRVNEANVAATRAGGAYYAIYGAVHAAMGDAQAWKIDAEAFERNAAAVQPDGQYVAHFGNLASNALFLGLPAMALYERCFALARTFKMDVYEAAFASHASFERWLHGDDEAFARFAALASAHDGPIPALHAYVLLAGLLSGSGTVPPAREIDAMIAGGRNEFFGPLTGVYARRLARGGDTRGARRVLDAAVEKLDHPYGAWETLTAIAEFGSAAARERVESLIQPYAGSNAPAFAATAAMVRALGAHRDGDEACREREAAIATRLYATMGWVRHERAARELGSVQTEQRFSSREREIAGLLQEGRSNRAMAEALFISEKTVEKHLARLYEKLQVNNRAAAVRALTNLPAQE